MCSRTLLNPPKLYFKIYLSKVSHVKQFIEVHNQWDVFISIYISAIEQADTEYICDIVSCVELNTFKYIKVGLCCFWREKYLKIKQFYDSKTQSLMSANDSSVFNKYCYVFLPFLSKIADFMTATTTHVKQTILYYPIIATYYILSITFFHHGDVLICYI